MNLDKLLEEVKPFIESFQVTADFVRLKPKTVLQSFPRLKLTPYHKLEVVGEPEVRRVSDPEAFWALRLKLGPLGGLYNYDEGCFDVPRTPEASARINKQPGSPSLIQAEKAVTEQEVKVAQQPASSG